MFLAMSLPSFLSNYCILCNHNNNKLYNCNSEDLRLCQVSSALCFRPVTPANTIVEPGPDLFEEYSFDSLVNVSCNYSAFYIPTPTSPAVYSRTCISGTVWSGYDILPECIKGYCEIDPGDPPNSTFVGELDNPLFEEPLPSGAKSYGTTRIYRCKEGFINVVGNGTLRCDGDDIWSNANFGECTSMLDILN